MQATPLTTILVPILLSTAAAFAVVQWSVVTRTEPSAPPVQQPDAAAQAQIAESLARIEARLGTVEERLTATERMAARAAIAPAIPEPDARAPQLVDAAAPLEGAAEDQAKPKLATFLAELAAPDLSDEDWTSIWKRITDAGHLEAAVAHFEAAAANDPRNADKQVAVGAAYLQKLFTVGAGPEAGTWATKADKAFDTALTLDPQHWDARNAKATSLAFWPPIFGKQKEAIRHFEILVQQQEDKGFDLPKYAQSYVFLGNLYEQNGEKDKAAAVRARGAKRFPQNKQLNGN